MPRALDLTDRKFNRLTCLEAVGRDDKKQILWRVRCDCVDKTEFVIAGTVVKSGHTKSCGCLEREVHTNQKHDLTGQQFGNLIVLRESPKSRKKRPYWACECQCSNKPIVHVSATHLSSGHTTSCRKGECHEWFKHGESKTVNYRRAAEFQRRIINGEKLPRAQIKDALKALKQKQKYCSYCGAESSLTIDHIIPINRGGSNLDKNLCVACGTCNRSKGIDFLSDWLLKRRSTKYRPFRDIEAILRDLGFDSWQHLTNYESNYRTST